MKAYISKVERERLIALMLNAGCDKDKIAEWSNGIQKSGTDCEQPGPLGVVIDNKHIFFARLEETYFDMRPPVIIRAPGAMIGGGR